MDASSWGGEGSSPSHRQQVIPVNALVLPNLIVCADTASVDHDTSLRVRLGVEQVVAFGAEMKRSLYSRTSGEGSVEPVKSKPPNSSDRYSPLEDEQRLGLGGRARDERALYSWASAEPYT